MEPKSTGGIFLFYDRYLRHLSYWSWGVSYNLHNPRVLSRRVRTVEKIMMQWRMILAVGIVALGAAAIWAWQEGSQHGDATLAHAVPSAPVQQPQLPAPDQAVVSDSSPTPTSSPPG